MDCRTKRYIAAFVLSAALHVFLLAQPFGWRAEEKPRPLMVLRLVSAPPVQSPSGGLPEMHASAPQELTAPEPKPASTPLPEAKPQPPKAKTNPKPEPKRTAPKPRPPVPKRTQQKKQPPKQQSANVSQPASTPSAQPVSGAKVSTGAAGTPGALPGRQTGAVQDISRAVVLKSRAPVYPRASRIQGDEGRVVLIVSVASGAVTRVTVEKSSGHAALDASAVRALKQWRFIKSLTAQVRVPVTFSLGGVSIEP